MSSNSTSAFRNAVKPASGDKLKRPNTHGAQSQQRAQSGGDGVTAGLASVLTHEAQQTAAHLAVAEEFSGNTAKALAHKAHQLSSGQHFRSTFQQELARLQQEQPPADWDTFDFSGLEAVISEAKKPLLPPQTVNFLPAGK